MGRVAMFGLCFAGMLAGTPPPLAAGAERASMTYRDGRLSASIVAVPIRQVIGEIGRLSGMAVEGAAALDDAPVSVSFVDLPLANAFERILGATSFALVVSSEGGVSHPSRIVILPS